MTARTLNFKNTDRLAFLAALAAIEAPEHPNRFARAARVRWSLIAEIRAELDAAGVDWRTACREVAATTTRSERP
jgi:hypothetical protein